MLWILFAVALVLWLAGVISAYTFNGLIHLLLVIALVLLVVNLLQGRRVV